MPQTYCVNSAMNCGRRPWPEGRDGRARCPQRAAHAIERLERRAGTDAPYRPAELSIPSPRRHDVPGRPSLFVRLLLALLLGALSCVGAQKESPPSSLRLEAADDAWVLVHPSSADRIKISRLAPQFDFGSFQIGGKTAGTAEWRRRESDGQIQWVAEWSLKEPCSAEIRAVLRLSPRDNLLRKTAELRLQGNSAPLLRSVLVDEADVSGQSPAQSTGWQSYPVIGRSFFLGIEFPVATTQVTGEKVRLSHAPGKHLQPGEWFVSRAAVYGVGEPGKVRQSFESYIRGLRPTPHGIHVNYNSWWTSPVPYTEGDIMEIIGQFRDHLFEPYRAAIDTFTIDMGWAKNTTLWQIDPALFPRGFTNLAQACGQVHARPGLWISPSGMYGQALDLAWARTAGYEADTKACLGGPRYQAALKQSLLDMTRKYGLRQIKFDGYVPTCDATNHVHPPGALSAEPIAEGIIDIFRSLREVAPDLWMEPTCFGFNPSPWWLGYCNSVIGTFGDDAPHGRVPCPTYRESYTTGRDYYNLKGAQDILFPIAAQEVLGIIHQTDEPLQNDAVVTVLRGHQFLPLYIHPKFMTPRRWEFLAALLQWARLNQDILEDTRPIFPNSWRSADGGLAAGETRAASRDPYGYAHTKGDRSLICLRNPWIMPATATLDLARDAGLSPTATTLAAVMIYPQQETLVSDVNPLGPLVVELAPYETRVIEIKPAAAPLPPESPHPPPPHVLARTIETSQLKINDSGPALGSNYTLLLPGNGPYLRARFSAPLPRQETGTRELLLLVEGETPVSAPLCKVTVKPPPTGGPSSAPQTPSGPSAHDPTEKNLQYRTVSSETGWRATGALAPEHWLWLAAACPAEAALIKGEIILTDPAQTVAAYLVNRSEVAWNRMPIVDGSRLPPPEFVYTASQEFFRAKLSKDLPMVTEGAPIERIDGLYLDALPPVSVKQGWGKLERNQSVWEKPLTIGGRRVLRGLGTPPPPQVVYGRGGKYRRFPAGAGADQATGPTITMAVKVDGTLVWESGLLTKESAPQRIEVSVSGARRLELIAGDGGNGIGADHADWADAALRE